MRWTRTTGHQNLFCAHFKRCLFADNLDRIRVDEARIPFQRAYIVSPQLRLDHIDLARHYAIRAKYQVLHVDTIFQHITLSVKRALTKATEIKHRFAQRLARDRAGVNAHPADRALAIDDGNFPSQLRGADRALLACGTAADDDQVIFVGIHTGLVKVTSSRGLREAAALLLAKQICYWFVICR